MIESQLLQAAVEGAADRVRREVFVPDLGGDMQILARDAGGRDRGADRLLIGVHFRGVDVAIAERERAFDRGAADIALHAEGAESEPGQADALGLQLVHRCSLKDHGPPRARRPVPNAGRWDE